MTSSRLIEIKQIGTLVLSHAGLIERLLYRYRKLRHILTNLQGNRI
ncbi:MAG: hypothetical protein ACR2M3_18040 [Thermomicrobiales bacterium]